MTTHTVRDKPFSPACERNREPILDVLRVHFADRKHVLEIGSGTGQHAVHFAAAMPWLTWQCSERMEHLAGIASWLDAAGLPNTPAPIALDVVAADAAAAVHYDAVFTANTLHIMARPQVEKFFDAVDMLADSRDATLVVYGPFNYGGDYTSDSNRAFDDWLKARDPHAGIRDFEAVDALAQAKGLQRIDDIAMPANNRCIIWNRS